MSPENDTPQHDDDEPFVRDRLCWQATETGCCVCVQDKGHESGLDDHCSHGVLMTCRRTKPSDSELAAALDLIGRRTDVVAVQLPEPDEGVWYINDSGCNVHLGPPGGVLVDAGAMLWGINTDEARTLAAALLAAAARADAANGGAK